MSIEKCRNCEQVIGNLEEKYIHLGSIVCTACKKRLEEDSQIVKVIGSNDKTEIPITETQKRAKIVPKDVEQQKINICLPYSISNIIFMESLVVKILFIILLLGIVFEKNFSIEIILPLIMSLGLFIVLKFTIWKWALGGKIISTILTYVFYIPIVLYALAMLVFFLSSLSFSSTVGMITYAIPILFAVIMVICIVINLFEKGLVDFVKLNGKCPNCEGWNFGQVKKPCTKECPNCKTILEFIRMD